MAFTSTGWRGELKGRGALLNTTTLLDTASPGAERTCTYMKYTGVWYRTYRPQVCSVCSAGGGAMIMVPPYALLVP